MNKEERKKGEEYLKKWAQNIKKIQALQEDINKLRKENDVFETIQIENKKDIIETYDNILQEKLEQLKQLIYEYKIVDDVVKDLDEYKKKLVSLRYIKKDSWQSIAMKCHISLRQCFNIKNNIIEQILDRI